MKPMPPPDMPPSIQKPQKSAPNCRPHLIDQRLGVEVARPGDDGLDRPEEVARGRGADGRDVAASQERRGFRRGCAALRCRAAHSGFGAQQVFLGHHLEDRSDVLRHAAVDEDQAVLQLSRASRRRRRRGQNVVARQQAAPADAVFRIAWPSRDAFDELDARPDAAGILPAAAGAAEPLAQDGARGDEPALGFRQWAVERLGLPGGPHADGDQRGEQVGGDRQARALGDAVDAADELQPMPGPDDARQQIGQALPGTFDARRHDARRDHARP